MRVKTNLARVAIVLLIVAEVVWIIAPRHGSFLSHEQMEALHNYNLTHTPPNNPEDIQKLLYKPVGVGALAMYAVGLLILNGALIFGFRNLGRRNKSASDSSAAKTGDTQQQTESRLLTRK